MVRRTEFICRRIGSKGASKSTLWIDQHAILDGNPSLAVRYLRPVLSKLLSAKASGYLGSKQTVKTTRPLKLNTSTYSFLKELITALVKGLALSVV